MGDFFHRWRRKLGVVTLVMACVLAGGAARLIARHLSIPVRLVDNLVLEGLVRIARDSVK